MSVQNSNGMELRKMGRQELLEYIIELQQENDGLLANVDALEAEKEALLTQMNALAAQEEASNGEIERLTAMLADRNIRLKRAGTMAEASLQLTRIFEEADAAVRQYTENIIRMESEIRCSRDAIIARAEAEASEIIKNAEEEAAEKDRKLAEHWSTVSGTLEKFYQDYKGVEEQ